MRYLITYGICALLILNFNSCRKENVFDCFKSTGEDIIELRDVGSFRTIEVFDKVKVNIYKGSEYKVEVVAGKNIIRNISTKVTEGALLIENLNTCNFVRGYKREVNVNVTVPHVRKVTNSGVATVRFANDFWQDTLVVRTQNSGDTYINGLFNEVRISSHGNGDTYLSGASSSFYVYTYGTNYVKADNFVVSDYMFVETISIGSCYINCTNLQRLEYNIHSKGNIFYTGTPAYITDFSSGEGSGKAIPK
jgi:hypothetical protein